MSKIYYVYILTNKVRDLLYVGITDDLMRRIWEHMHGMREGFTKKYGIHRLVYYERIVMRIKRCGVRSA